MLPSGLPEHVADEEPVARFLTSDSQFNSKGAKPSAFMPGPKDSKTSVFRQGADPAHLLWEMGDHEIGTERRIRAAAMLTAAAVRQATLEVESQEPPPKHANISGWPNAVNDSVSTKAQCKEFALLLSQAAVLVRR